MGPAARAGRLIAWGVLLLAVGLAAAVRVRLIGVPLERDEGEFAYAGQLMLRGIPPYRFAYNMKLPGTYAAYAAIMSVFGQTARGIHLGLLAVNLATVVLLYLLARRLFDERTGAMAAACYALLSLGQGVFGVFAHATHFVVLPVLAGTLLLARLIDAGAAPPRPPRWPALLVSGALFGAGFVMKQHGILFVLSGAAWLAWELIRRKDPPRRVAGRCAGFLLGAFIPFGLTCALLAAAGVFKDFWFWTFDYARAYVSEVSLSDGVTIFVQAIRGIAAPALPLWILAAAGAAAPLWDETVRRRVRFLAVFAAGSLLSICPGFYFREHYFVLLLPAVALLAAVAVTSGGRALEKWLSAEQESAREAGLAEILPIVMLGAALLYPVFQERTFFFSLTPVQASRRTYGANPFPEAVEIARRIAADTAPDDRVAVLGSEPEIFFYSGRRSATGHIYMYGLMESQPYASRMQQSAIKEIEASEAKYLVYVNVPSSWLVRPDSDTTILTWARTYISAHYEVAGVADIVSDDSTVYAWGEEAARYAPRSPYVVYVFRRIS